MKPSMYVIPIALTALVLAAPASAAIYDVNTTGDPAGAGCIGAGPCSLRQAIDKVNTGAGTGDTINVPAGNYKLLITNLSVTKPVAIVGKGGTGSTIVDGNASFKLFFFAGTATPSSITAMTLTNGQSTDGGGIANVAALTLTDVAVVGNSSGNFDAGGIANDGGTLTIDRSTIAGNKAGANGGGIYNQGTLTVTNSTISGNTANTNSALYDGGGLVADGPTVVSNTTIAGNTAAEGGGIKRTTGTVTLSNSIVAANVATGSGPPNCTGSSYISAGGNLEDADSCNFNQASDLRSTPAGLGPLGNNGGPTDTRALLAGSAAIDHGVNCPPPATDQRGIARPQGPSCDSGAFELEVAPPLDTSKPVVSGLKFGASTFAAAPSGGSIAAKRKRVPVGTTVSFTLSEAANAAFTVERVTKGRKQGKKCKAKRKKGKRCTIYKTAGSFTRASTAGQNSLKFTGRVGGKALKRGKYRLSLLATDAAGNKSTAQRKSFTIKKR